MTWQAWAVLIVLADVALCGLWLALCSMSAANDQWKDEQ